MTNGTTYQGCRSEIVKRGQTLLKWGTDLAFMMQTALGRGTPAKQSTANEAELSAEDERERRVKGPTRSGV